MEHGREKADKLLGARGKILATCGPRLAELPGQDAYPDPPRVPAQAAQHRLFVALAETLGAYSDEWPMLLVLDDLQWADELSLRFLSWLGTAFFDERAVLIVATYRAEEASDALRELASRPYATHENLGPLESRDDERNRRRHAGARVPAPVVRGGVGGEGGGEPLLRWGVPPRGRRGGARTARPGGALDGSGRSRSPAARYASRPRPPPSRGAHPGRARAPRGRLRARPQSRFRAARYRPRDRRGRDRPAVRELLARQILEESEPGTLRFLHDKLREYTYEQVGENARRTVHLAAANALERREARHPVSFPALYPRLAHHFSRAGHGAKAIVYLEKAGEQALARFANRDAIRFFREALSLDHASAEIHPGAPLAALPLDVRLRRARWERQLADAHYPLGELDLVVVHGRRALAWLGRPLPESGAGWLAQLSADLPRQLFHRLLPASALTHDETERALEGEAAMANQRLAVRFYYNFDALPMIATSLRAVNFAERAGGTVSAAATYGMLGMVVGISKLHRLGNVYADLARDVGCASGDRAGLVFALYAKAAWRMGDAAWSEVRGLCREALDLGNVGGAPDPQTLRSPRH